LGDDSVKFASYEGVYECVGNTGKCVLMCLMSRTSKGDHVITISE
jgi:hypothetical protein